jgi:RNA polymerase sigma-70 factor (ECF subfamily)
VLLESLSPIERAVFLLREVFDYSYAEIAPVVGKSQDNCRQYYRRAQQFITERRPRFEPSSATQEKLVESFLQALSTGDVETLKEVLVEDVELYGDGGGKARSIRQPIIGRDAVVRFLVTGIYRQLPPDIIIGTVKVNGMPAICFWQQDSLLCLMTFSMAANRIEAIHNILNPDKLIYFQWRSALNRTNDR